MLTSVLKPALVAIGLMLIGPVSASADLPSVVNFVVLRVSFSDFPKGSNGKVLSRFDDATTQGYFNNISQLWNNTSYGNISITYQFAGNPENRLMPKMSTSYLDTESGQSSSNAAIDQLVTNAVANAPTTIDWSNVYGVVVLFSDTRTNGFYRGITRFGQITLSPPSGPKSKKVFASIVGENPSEDGGCPSLGDVPRTWGRWAHEMGHQMQANPGNPWHPSNYNSDFEIMDREYPAQSGVFNKQPNTAFPGWLPPEKYLVVNPPEGGVAGLLAEERPPEFQPLYQAIKAFLTFGAPKQYYLISVRRRVLGDDLATCHGPNGTPDEGVLIERVVEGGDPNIKDSCDSMGKNCTLRWVNVIYKGGITDTLWKPGDTYSNPKDGIFISVLNFIDSSPNLIVEVRYTDTTGQPDVGINSWLEPPGNTYETTDIWIDSPVNGYASPPDSDAMHYRYGIWKDLMGGMVPKGNGDDPAVGLVNRLYARVRNYGSMPATNVVVHFDITDPPGVGIAGANGFVELGTVTSKEFPGLASIPAGGTVDVYLNWTPNFSLTPQQMMEGRFAFHTCIRVRLDHVAGETFFANQDGNGQQENIAYFQASSQGAPGAPGAPNEGVVHLRNDDPSESKQFVLSVFPETLPDTWEVEINNGNPIVDLGPGEVTDVPVLVTQTQPEPVGSQHSFRIIAASQITLRNEELPGDFHNEIRPLGGVQMQVAVLRKTALECQTVGLGRVQGRLIGANTQSKPLSILVVGVDAQGGFIPDQMAQGPVDPTTGSFTAIFPAGSPLPRRAVCLFAGTTEETSAGSSIFALLK